MAALAKKISASRAAQRARAKSRTAHKPSWRVMFDQGRFSEGHAEAMQRGAYGAVAMSRWPLPELWALASVARLSRDAKHARHALETLRDRFPGTGRARMAAFLLGRVAIDLESDPAFASRWFEIYLLEDPSGSLVEEALGRLIDAHAKSGQNIAAQRAATRYLDLYPEGTFAALARVQVR